MTDAPRISDAEVEAFINAGPAGMCFCDKCRPSVRQALAAFLRARVPERMPENCEEWCDGYNDCIDQVIRGRE